MAREHRLGPEAAIALQFLDRRPGEWYCTACWAEAVAAPQSTLEQLSALVATQDAMAASYQAWAGGPCKRCQAKDPAAGVKGLRSVRSLGRRGKP